MTWATSSHPAPGLLFLPCPPPPNRIPAPPVSPTEHFTPRVSKCGNSSAPNHLHLTSCPVTRGMGHPGSLCAGVHRLVTSRAVPGGKRATSLPDFRKCAQLRRCSDDKLSRRNPNRPFLTLDVTEPKPKSTSHGGGGDHQPRVSGPCHQRLE